ncbi:MAG: hypothetical protein IPK85_05975 [Gemmatimonadetes bacterium]|nr:hypothetical protein [Gemmatimonadota bacterium]
MRNRLLCAVLGIAATLGAQQPARFDTALVRRATLAQLLDGARIGDSIAGFRTSSPVVDSMVQSLLRHLDRPELRRLPLHVIGDSRASWGVVGRRTRPVGYTARDTIALNQLAEVVGQEYRDALASKLSRAGIDSLLDPFEAFDVIRRAASKDMSLEKLRRFERKYGPGTPKLNLAEVVLNYGAQWLPAFRPNDEGWPSRHEVVAAYVPTYLTYVEKEARAVSVLELGVRSYTWNPRWGGRTGGVLRPGYWSIGAAMAGEADGAVTNPFKGRSRFGAFFGWGDAKIAWIGGSERRVLVTRQVQLVPWGF